MRCACGNSFHSDDSHIGRRIKCRCGRIVTIARPPEPEVHKKGRKRKRSAWSRVRNSLAPAWQATSRWLARGIARTLQDFVHPQKSRRWTTRAAWLVLLGMITTWALLLFASEKFLPATMLAYGPRMFMLAPVILVAPFVLFFARRALVPLAFSVWIALVPIMGARVSLATLGKSLPVAPQANEIRVVSFNVLVGGSALAPRLEDFVREYNPHLMGFQECGETLFEAMQRLEGWYVHRVEGLCTASVWPLVSADEMETSSRARRALIGGLGNLVRYDIESPHGPLVFVNVHLPTARYGLQALVQHGGGGLVPSDPVEAVEAAARTAAGTLDPAVEAQLRSNRLARDIASERAALRAWNGAPDLPVIVVGDFNLPVESTIFSRHWSHFTNAFEEVGSGLGYSKIEGKLLRIRIDHILTNGRVLQPVRAYIGKDWRSDHRPVIADFVRLR